MPASALLGALSAKCVTGAGVTVIPLKTAVRLLLPVSVADNDRRPTVLRVAAKVPTPLSKVALPGNKAAGSEQPKATEPL